MKAKLTTSTLVLISLLISVQSLIAVNENETVFDLDEYQVIASAPKLKQIVEPQLSGSMIGQRTTLLFTINKNGHTSNVRFKGSSVFLNDLTIVMKRAVEKWTYEPARDADGNPVAIKVELPVEVSSKKKDNKVYACVTLGSLKKVA